MIESWHATIQSSVTYNSTFSERLMNSTLYHAARGCAVLRCMAACFLQKHVNDIYKSKKLW